MKTYRRKLLLAILAFYGIAMALHASDLEKIQKMDSVSLNLAINKSAAKMVEKLSQDVQLSTGQKAQLQEKAIEYQTNRQEIIRKVKSNNGKPELTIEQKEVLQATSYIYRKAIESILTAEQKAVFEDKKEQRLQPVKEKVEKELEAKLTKNK